MVINPNNSRHQCEGYPQHEVDLPCTAHGPVKPPGFPCQVCQVHDRDPWQPLPHPWWPLWRPVRPVITGDFLETVTMRRASYVFFGGYIFLVRKYKNSQIYANFTYTYQEDDLSWNFRGADCFVGCLFFAAWSWYLKSLFFQTFPNQMLVETSGFFFKASSCELLITFRLYPFWRFVSCKSKRHHDTGHPEVWAALSHASYRKTLGIDVDFTLVTIKFHK